MGAVLVDMDVMVLSGLEGALTNWVRIDPWNCCPGTSGDGLTGIAALDRLTIRGGTRETVES